MSSTDDPSKVDLGEVSDPQLSIGTKKTKKGSKLQNFFSNNRYVYEIVNNFNDISSKMWSDKFEYNTIEI